jgi:hypothetical protein
VLDVILLLYNFWLEGGYGNVLMLTVCNIICSALKKVYMEINMSCIIGKIKSLLSMSKLHYWKNHLWLNQSIRILFKIPFLIFGVTLLGPSLVSCSSSLDFLFCFVKTKLLDKDFSKLMNISLNWCVDDVHIK